MLVCTNEFYQEIKNIYRYMLVFANEFYQEIKSIYRYMLACPAEFLLSTRGGTSLDETC